MSLFKNVDLHAELDKLADRGEQERLLSEAVEHLFDDVTEEEMLRTKLADPQEKMADIDVSQLDETRIYSKDQIRDLSVKYRLRFLSTELYRSAIPREALFELRHLQSELGTPLSGFKILAPSKLFKLRDCNEDPLLFLSLPNDQYYLIHKWGNDLAWFRSFVFLPFRSIHTLMFSLFMVALSIGLGFPESWFYGTPKEAIPAMRGFLTMYSMIAICGLSILFAFAFSKNTSSNSWDSKFFN